ERSRQQRRLSWGPAEDLHRPAAARCHPQEKGGQRCTAPPRSNALLRLPPADPHQPAEARPGRDGRPAAAAAQPNGNRHDVRSLLFRARRRRRPRRLRGCRLGRRG
ncbi:unnamed protein product, partial [Ectocarpus sp. 8 AP-2014]